MRTSSELLSNWFTWTTSAQGLSERAWTPQHTINNNNSNVQDLFIPLSDWNRHNTAASSYRGQSWWTRTCWSWGWCILRWLADWGCSPERHRYTPVGTPAGVPPPFQTLALGWEGGNQNAAGMKKGRCKSRLESPFNVMEYLSVDCHLLKCWSRRIGNFSVKPGV